jgi:peptidoglycan hydrolase-like protein with peptidoglycan-binding domain
MRISFLKGIPVGLLLLTVPAFASVHPKTGSSKKHYHASLKEVSVKHRRGFLHLRAAHEERSPVVMPAERATEIQTALIKQGYLTGEPTGTWDAQTVSAMQKLQGDNGWQTKITPDSRALIKLGLGPTDTAPAPSGDVALGSSKTSSQDFAQTHPQ